MALGTMKNKRSIITVAPEILYFADPSAMRSPWTPPHFPTAFARQALPSAQAV